MNAERELVARAIRGDSGALETLAIRYHPVARRTAYGLIGDAEAADDVAQQAMVRLHAALPGFRQASSLSTWLHRVTLNLAYDHLRRLRRRRDDVPLSGAPEVAASSVSDPHVEIDAERARKALQVAMERLPEDQREALVLRYMSELSYAEIATITGAPAGTVASRIFRALERLGSELEPKHLEILR